MSRTRSAATAPPRQDTGNRSGSEFPASLGAVTALVVTALAVLSQLYAAIPLLTPVGEALHIRPRPAGGGSAESCGNVPAFNTVEILPCAEGSALHMGDRPLKTDVLGRVAESCGKHGIRLRGRPFRMCSTPARAGRSFSAEAPLPSDEAAFPQSVREDPGPPGGGPPPVRTRRPRASTPRRARPSGRRGASLSVVAIPAGLPPGVVGTGGGHRGSPVPQPDSQGVHPRCPVTSLPCPR